MKFRLTLLFALFSFFGFSQSWTHIDESQIQLSEDQERQIIPTEYKTYQLHIEQFQEALKSAPDEFINNRKEKDVLIELPMPDGRLESFKFFRSEVMEKPLSEKYPMIKSYKGYSIDRTKIARISISPYGFYGSIRTHEGPIYIDPYADNQTDYYISYFTKNHRPDASTNTSCGTKGSSLDPNDVIPGENFVDFRSPTDVLPLRTYRFALACTGGWGQFQSSVESALAKMVTGTNRLNLIFESEMGIRLLLLGNNDLLIHLNPNTDPYPNNQSGTNQEFPNWQQGCLYTNTGVVNGIVGFTNYDIGHIWSNCSDTGGVAFLGSACNNNKGGGVTCIGGNSNVTNVVVNITAHELGHQFSANHSFNHCDQDNENIGTGFEPGSGSTIMSYAGLCGPQNVQGFNEDNFNVGSLQEMVQFTRIGSVQCAEEIETTNNEPTATIPLDDDFYIPIETPFEMTGIGEDEDENDVLTYSWEQYNFGPLSDLGVPIANAPSFRVFYPSENPTRVFPRIDKIINKTFEKTEVLPTYSRNYRFRFVVRDNNEEAGAIAWDEVEFNAVAEAGPFLVDYPNFGENFEVGQTIEVVWDVANTDVGPINCEKVDIFLSTDGGFTYPIQLAGNEDNDGSAEVIVPLALGNQNRVKVKARDNIFFDISDFNFIIDEPSTPGFYYEMQDFTADVCLPESVSYGINTAGFGGFTDNVHFEVIGGLPEGAVATFVPNDVAPSESTALNIDLSNVIVTGDFEIQIEATANGASSIQRTVELKTTGTDFSSLATVYPEQGQAGTESLPTFSWTTVPDASSYTIEVSTDPNFGSSNIIYEENITDTFFVSNFILENSTLYYWRVKAQNKCLDGNFTEIRAFGSQALNCNEIEDVNLPLNISQSGTPTIDADFVITAMGEVQEVVVKRVKGGHQKVSDLRATLISPAGTEVLLWNKKCGNLSNFDLGLNDSSPTPVQCPLTGGPVYKPEESLSILAGEEITGVWKVRIEDTASGNGGTFQEATLEICSNATVDNPVLINNNVLGVPPNGANPIMTELLLTEDPNNTASELIYTVVQLPLEGDLYYNSDVLTVGSQFSQELINQGRIRYRHNGGSLTEDHFLFTVVDGEGGFIDITQYDVQIDESFTSQVQDIDRLNNIRVFPNPASHHIQIEVLNMSIQNLDIRLYDMVGRLVLNQKNQSNSDIIQTTDITNGTYILELNLNGQRYQKRVIVSK